MATSRVPESVNAAFQMAVASFAASLTDKQRREFQGCSLKEVEDTIRGVEARLASQRQQRNMQRVSRFLEGMDQLGKVIEVFVNCDSTVAFIWGPIKFVLLAIGTWVETLDCLLDTYVDIGEFLPSLSQFEGLLAKYPGIGIHLHRYYCDVLEFHRNALSVFSRPNWKIPFYSAWRTFKTQFGPILTKLKRHRDLLSGEKLIAAVTDVHQSVQVVEDKVNTLSRHLQHLYLVDDEEISLRHREDLVRKRQFVLSKLDPPDYLYDLEKASNERHDPTSGDWLLADTTFGIWADVTTMEPRDLYLNGIPGSGKTIATARVVQHLQQLRASGGNTNVGGFVLLYFFFKHHQHDKRTFVAMLLSFLSQTLFQDEVLLDLIHKRCTLADQQKIRSESLLRELAKLVLQAQRRCFIVVDALDECDGDQLGKPEDAQGIVIDWLESLREHQNGSKPSDRCIRLLISGQRNGVLDQRLKHWPAIRLDSSSSHMNDIKMYCEAKRLQIRQEFDALEDIENISLDIIRRVTSRAKGMFLYAKVVLSNLLDQPTLGDFERELQEEIFPQGIDQAYERVAVHILENRIEKRFGVARRILNLVICAERPLRWKEIQSHFSIDVQSETANPKSRLLKTGKQYCGSLVEISRTGEPRPQGPGPDDVLELVHETARMYLLQTGTFHLANLHAEMALFCAQYLRSSPFTPDTCKSAVKTHCMTGYYGFLDYAAANWWKHARRFEGSGDNITLRVIAKLADSLNPQHKLGVGASASDMTAVWNRLRQGSDDGRDWEHDFPVQNRIRLIRDHFEKILGRANTESPADLAKLAEFYGCLGYKCSKPWCSFFQDGFETASARDSHVRRHELPFRCSIDGCFRFQIGFARESELARHNKDLHSEAVSVCFPSDIRGNIFNAAAQGQLEVIQDLVSRGTSVNTRDKDDSTPLFLAARAGNCHVCRWLLEHGAEADARCTKQSLTALYEAVAKDDVELAILLIVDFGADIYVRTSIGESLQTLMQQKRCIRVREAFPPEFWNHEPPTKSQTPPHNPDDLGGLDPERLSGKKVGDDWWAVINQNGPRLLDIDLVHTLQHESAVCCVRFSHDGKYVATACNWSAQIYDVATGKKICVLQDDSIDFSGAMYIRSVCFSPDGKYLATCAEDKLIRIWDIPARQIRTTFAGHDKDIYSIDFARDGRTIASGSSDRTVRIWDLETGTSVRTLTVKDGVTAVAISPDTKLVAASCFNTSVRVWEINTGYLLDLFEGPDGHTDTVFSIAFSPNKRELFSGSFDKTIKLWELNTSRQRGWPAHQPLFKAGGHCIKTFEGHRGYVLSVALTPDSGWVLSGSKDQGVQFWDPRTGKTQLMLQGHKNSVISVATSPVLTQTGSLFATGSGDTRARIWSYTQLDRRQ